MEKLLLQYNNAKTLIQYLVYGIIIKIIKLVGKEQIKSIFPLLSNGNPVDVIGRSEASIDVNTEPVNKPYIPTGEKSRFALITLHSDDYLFAEDFINWNRNSVPTKCLFFFPDRDLVHSSVQFGNGVSKVAFGIKLFLGSQASLKENNIAGRLYYSRLLKALKETDLSLRQFIGDPQEAFIKFFIPTVQEIINLIIKAFYGKLKRGQGKKLNPSISYEKDLDISDSINPLEWKNIVITGWYGTETNGDKAILGELFHLIDVCSPDCEVTITSMCPWISHQTNIELGRNEKVRIISLEDASDPSLIKEVDCVIIGGGPLMESSSLSYILSLFEEARLQKKPRIIFGCGIGPIHSKGSLGIIKNILDLTSAGFLRDKESYEYALKICPNHNLKWACDPAFAYVYRWARGNENTNNGDHTLQIAGLLRANTKEFINELDPPALLEANNKVAVSIAKCVEPVCNERNAVFRLLQMNATWIGGDDRLFNRKVEQAFIKTSSVKCIREYLTLDEQLKEISDSDVAVAMRYHGHIFCIALGIPFLSINYTGKAGKVESLLNRVGYKQWSLAWADIDVETSGLQLLSLIDQRQILSSYLLEKADLLIRDLYKTYYEVFGITIKR